MSAPSGPGLTHLAVVPVYVTDQERALAFYRDALGFTVHTDVTFGDQRWIEVGPSGADTHLSIMRVTEVPFDARVAIGPAYSFATANAAASHESLLSSGVEVGAEPKAEPWGTWFPFNDPDGNSFVVSESRA